MRVTLEMLQELRLLALEGIAERAPLAITAQTLLALLDAIVLDLHDPDVRLRLTEEEAERVLLERNLRAISEREPTMEGYVDLRVVLPVSRRIAATEEDRERINRAASRAVAAVLEEATLAAQRPQADPTT